jgi:hypothetical protein
MFGNSGSSGEMALASVNAFDAQTSYTNEKFSIFEMYIILP